MKLTSQCSLFDLIQSLNSSEKRYLRRYINQSGEHQSNHIKLFDALSKQDEYDEEKLKKKFRNTSLLKQWSRVKNYLFNYILRVLQQYHYQYPEFEIYNHLQQIRILNRKVFFDEALKALKKAKTIALEGGHAALLPKIAEWEMVLSRKSRYEQGDEEIPYQDNNKRATNLAHNLLKYNEAAISVWGNSVEKGRHIKLEEHNTQLLQQSLYSDEKEACTPMAKWFFYVSKTVLHAQICQYYNAYQNAKACLELHDRFPLLQKYAPFTYVSSLNNFVQSVLDAQQWDEIPLLMNTIDDYCEKNKDTSRAIMLKSVKYVAILHSLTEQKKFQEALSYAPEIESFLEEGIPQENRYRKPHILLHYLVPIYITNEKYQIARQHIDYLETIQQVPIFKNTQLLLKLIVLFEQEEHLLLPYAIRSVYRKFYQKKDLYSFERIVLNLLKAASKAISKDDLNVIFRKYLNKLKKFASTANSSELELLQHFDFIVWMESKVMGTSLLEIHRKIGFS